MNLSITTELDPDPTAALPFTVPQFKAWANLPLSFAEDDALIGEVIIPDVMDHLTRLTSVSYVRRKHTVQAGGFDALDFVFAGNGYSDWALSYYDAADALVEIDAADYRVETFGERVRVSRVTGSWPTVNADRLAPVRLLFNSLEALDGLARSAALSLCMVRYSNRGDDWSEKLPASVMGLIDLMKRRRAYS